MGASLECRAPNSLRERRSAPPQSRAQAAGCLALRATRRSPTNTGRTQTFLTRSGRAGVTCTSTSSARRSGRRSRREEDEMQLPRFSSEVRARFPGLAERLNDFEKTVEEYEGRYQERFTPKRHSGGRIVLRDAARVTLLSAHARARVLTWGVVTAVNAGLAAVLFLAA